MKQLLIYITAIVLLSVSSFSFAKAKDDKINELAFLGICVTVYDHLGLETKRSEQHKKGVKIASGMKKRDAEEVSARARIMYTAYRRSGAGIAELKYMCDESLYGDQ